LPWFPVPHTVTTLAASSGKCNVTVWALGSVRPFVLFLTLIERAAHTQRDSPGARDSASVHFRPSITKAHILTIAMHTIFTRRRYASAVSAMSVCLSVCDKPVFYQNDVKNNIVTQARIAR